MQADGVAENQAEGGDKPEGEAGEAVAATEPNAAGEGPKNEQEQNQVAEAEGADNKAGS